MTGLRFRSWLVWMVPALAICAEPNRSWDTLVKSIQPGETVVVTRMSSAKLEGKLLGMTAESITVKWHGEPKVVPREDVYRVRIANIRRVHTLTTMAAGGMFGAVMGALVSGRGTGISRGEGALLFGGAWAGLGAAVGGALPIGKPLYEAAERPRRADRRPVRD